MWLANRYMSVAMTLSDLERRDARGQNFLADLQVLPVSYQIEQRKILFWKKARVSDNLLVSIH